MTKFQTLFYNHRGRYCSKWQHYFEVYDRHLSHLIGQQFGLLEIGIAGGGSLQLWKQYFGAGVSVVGIDINPHCYFQEPQIETFIGDQTDVKFLQRVVEKTQIPQVVIDDGSHVQSHIMATFDYLYPLLPENSVYVIEDCHTSYWPKFEGGLNSHLNVVDILSRHAHDVNVRWFDWPKQPKLLGADSIHFYDSLIVIEKSTKSRGSSRVDVGPDGARIITTG